MKAQSQKKARREPATTTFDADVFRRQLQDFRRALPAAIEAEANGVGLNLPFSVGELLGSRIDQEVKHPTKRGIVEITSMLTDLVGKMIPLWNHPPSDTRGALHGFLAMPWILTFNRPAPGHKDVAEYWGLGGGLSHTSKSRLESFCTQEVSKHFNHFAFLRALKWSHPPIATWYKLPPLSKATVKTWWPCVWESLECEFNADPEYFIKQIGRGRPAQKRYRYLHAWKTMCLRSFEALAPVKAAKPVQ